MLKGFLFLLTSLLCLCGKAQTPHKDSIIHLNLERVETNKKGMIVLGSWAAVNIAAGAAGYFIAKDDEWKAFHGMNAIWNVVNGVIAYGGYLGASKEAGKNEGSVKMLRNYEADKRLFLLNAGLDVLYIGSGVFLREHAYREKDPAVWKGFGNSVALQGGFLLLFDGIMYASHQSKDRKWYRLMEGVCVTGNGIGYRYSF
jgi:hypothetical protein